MYYNTYYGSIDSIVWSIVNSIANVSALKFVATIIATAWSAISFVVASVYNLVTG